MVFLKRYRRLASEIIEQAEAKAQRVRDQLERERSEIEGERIRLREGQIALELERKALSEAKKEVERKQASVEQTRRGLVDLEGEKARILEELDQSLAKEKARRILRSQEDESEKRAKRLVVEAVQRLAVSCAGPITTTSVSLPSDQLKGRIVGREGRNIRVLEELTGCTFVVDDSPSSVLVSAYDPLRRYVAQQALTELIMDGRIHPTAIEEAVGRAKERAEEDLIRWGRDGARRAGIGDLHPELFRLLGRMHLRTSHGQNLLDHSVEVGCLLGMICAEAGLDEQLGRRIGLLHDVGKVMSHQMEGTHALIGRELAKKYGEKDVVANGIGCHHGEIEPASLEGSLCGAADAISGARVGARKESLESYARRVSRLEGLAKELDGVKEAYALQAGRDLHVAVDPEKVSEAESLILARKIANRIESELTSPGKIRVMVIRDHRSIVFAG